MKKRFLLPLLLFFLPATIIGAAYAGFVYSNKVDIKTDTNLGKIDDIKPNFKLDENNYTIYFFPSMQAVDLNFNNDFSEANIKSKIDGANKSKWGYWSNNSYYPKKIETHGGPSISLQQFDGIGEPESPDFDNHPLSWYYKYQLQFTGWTADKGAAKDGYAGQGDYKYLSAFDDLTKIDIESQDGTNKNDKIVFVYPIFTTGKAYDPSKNKNIVKLTASKPDSKDSSKTITKPRYLSRFEGAENATYFYYKNLVINEDESWSWDLSFAGLKNPSTWYGDWPYYRSGGNTNTPSYYIYKKGSNNSLIKGSGIYNIYAYLQRKEGKKTSFDEKAGNDSLYTTSINSNFIPLIYEDSFSNHEDYKTTLGSYNFWLFVKIEKVYEFRLAGTEGRGFTFDTAGQLYVSRFSSATYTALGGLWKMYYLDNVFMEKGSNNIFTEYINPSDINKRYKIRNTVFSFLPSDENLATINGIGPMTPDELVYVNENEPDLNVKGNYKGVSSETESTYKKIKKEGIPPESSDYSEYIKNPENLPNYAPGKDYADYFFTSEFKYSGFCKVLIKVDFATSGEHKGKPTSIRVAVAPYLTNVHKVYVYPDKTNLVTFRDPETNLIDPENNTTLKAIELTSFEMNASDDYLLKDQQITVKNNVTGNSTSMSLSNYLANHDVIDHLTNKAIKIGKSYKRHMACWQRTRTKK